METEDNQLIVRAQRGEEAAFEKLVYRYDRKVLNMALRFSENEDEAKDIYQDVFLRVFNALPHFRFESQFSTWLYRITTNVCLTYTVTKRKRRFISIDGKVEDCGNRGTVPDQSLSRMRSNENPHRAASSEEITRKIQEALSLLSPRQRIIFVLRHFEGHKLREIAAILRCAEGTVKKHLFSATHRVREQLSKSYPARQGE